MLSVRIYAYALIPTRFPTRLSHTYDLGFWTTSDFWIVYCFLLSNIDSSPRDILSLYLLLLSMDPTSAVLHELSTQTLTHPLGIRPIALYNHHTIPTNGYYSRLAMVLGECSPIILTQLWGSRPYSKPLGLVCRLLGLWLLYFRSLTTVSSVLQFSRETWGFRFPFVLFLEIHIVSFSAGCIYGMVQHGEDTTVSISHVSISQCLLIPIYCHSYYPGPFRTHLGRSIYTAKAAFGGVHSISRSILFRPTLCSFPNISYPRSILTV